MNGCPVAGQRPLVRVIGARGADRRRIGANRHSHCGAARSNRAAAASAPSAVAAESASGVDVQSVVAAHLFGIATAIRPPRMSQCAAIDRESGAGRHDRHPGSEARRRHHQRRRPVESVFGRRQHRRRVLAFGVSRPRHSGSRRRAGDADCCPLDCSPAGPAPGGARQIGADPNTAAAVDNVRRMVQQDPGCSTSHAHGRLIRQQGGKLRGFRVYPGRNRRHFQQAGLRPGDLVTAINGTRSTIRSAARKSSIRSRPRPRDRDDRTRRPESRYR
jgi:hypothetical protein